MHTNTGGVVGPGSTAPDGILIVDDSETNLVAYEAALAPLGRRLVLARSGADALRALLDSDFALVLLDFAMPDISGIETSRMVRARTRSGDTPILFISGASPSPEIVLEAFEIGALDFICKPIEPEVLRAKVAVYLQLQERTTLLLRQAEMVREANQQREHTHSVERERDAAKRTALRLEKLQELTAALGETRTPEHVASVVVRLGALAIGASAAAMWLRNDDETLSLAASHGVPQDNGAEWRATASDGDIPAIEVLRTAEPLWVETASDHRMFPFAALPLISGGRAIGVAAFAYEDPHAFTMEERNFLVAVARASEQALERARLHVAEAAARSAAELANKRKDEFLAMLGHELRNPLAAISSAVELVRLRGSGLERETSILQRQVRQLTHVVNELIDVSRITRGLITLKRDAVGVREAVDQAFEMLQSEAARDRHQVTIDVPAYLLVDADRTRLVQVMFNLMSNAVKYTPSPGRIDVSARTSDDFVVIDVRDNGRGIPPTLLSDMFELFVQGQRGLDRREGGLGIGLTLVRTLVHLHGGTIAVSSEGEGNGATFTVQWPRASRRTPTQELPIPAPQSRASASQPRALVVDDNPDAAEMLAMVVEASGFVVEIARDGATALESAATSRPDVVLLDIGLPGLDGFEVAVRLRALPGCDGTALIAVTGYGAPDDLARAKSAGFAEHLIKPVEPRRLRTVLEKYASNAKRD